MNSLFKFLFPSQFIRRTARRYLYRFHGDDLSESSPSIWTRAFSTPAARTRTLLTIFIFLVCGVFHTLHFTQAGSQQVFIMLGAGITSFLAVLALLLNFCSVFSTIAIFGITLGISALVVVLSITHGFLYEIQQRIISFTSHAVISNPYSGRVFSYQSLQKELAQDPRVVASAPSILQPMLLAKDNGRSASVIVKGMDPVQSARVLELDNSIQKNTQGTRLSLAQLLNPASSNAIVGEGLAQKLHLSPGDCFQLSAPLVAGDSPQEQVLASNPPPAQFCIVGLLHTGFSDIDSRMVLISLLHAQQIMKIGDDVSTIEVRLRHADLADSFVKDINQNDRTSQQAATWYQINANLFSSLSLQKAVLSLIVFLIIIVSSFNVVASLTMMVIEKTKHIAILKAMGTPAGSIAALFRILGTTLGIYGVGLGLGLGLLFCTLLRTHGYQLDIDMYKIDHIPVHTPVFETTMVAAASLIICFFATLYPALRAAKLSPAEGLRYE